MRYAFPSPNLNSSAIKGEGGDRRRVGWNLNLIIEFSVDVSYYSVGGLNHLKNYVSFILFRLIFRPKITLLCHITFRGVNHDVG